MVQTMSDYVKKINYKNVKEYERDLVTNKKIILKILKRNDKNKINVRICWRHCVKHIMHFRHFFFFYIKLREDRI